MTQAPTPGPLSASDVKLLVKGDLLRVTNADSFLEANGVKDGSVVRFRSADNTWIDLQEMDFPQGSSFARFAFIGRPDESGWMPWSGGEPTITDPTVDIEVRLRNGELHVDRSPAFDWTYDPEPHPFDIIAFRLAPTAPVEASGLEQLWPVGSWLSAALDDPKVCEAMKADIREWFDNGGHLRPQPSGETREVETEVQYEVWGAGPQGDFCAASDTLSDAQHYAAVYGQDGPVVIKVATTTRVEWTKDLLSARPLALGGQKGNSETLRVLLDNLVIAQTLSKDIRQKATDEARSYLYDLRPQPSGETREAVRLALEDADALERVSEEADDNQWQDWAATMRQAASRIRRLALLSTSPLALGGQQGEDEIAFLLDRLADFENDINERDWYGHVAPAIARVKAALSTTPARAEAQDEGAATDDLVDRFAVALKAKLRAAGEKYGFDDAWKADDWRDKLIEDLLRHIQKGDPRDVAAYCAFAWHHDWSLSPKQDDLRSAAFTDRGAEDRYVSQDEGAAGERDKRAWIDRWNAIEGAAQDALHTMSELLEAPNLKRMQYALGERRDALANALNLPEAGTAWMRPAHPSPTPAADADRVRIAVEALEKIRLQSEDNLSVRMETITSIADHALAALKSTAATEKTDV